MFSYHLFAPYMCLIDEKAKGVLRFHLCNEPAGDLMTKTILTFGDSNTYGTPPMSSHAYHPRMARRWPVVMAENVDCTLIEEGLGGRTACALPSHSVEPYLDGLLGLHIALRSHGPIDWLVIMLGTNDLQTRFGKTPQDVVAGIAAMMAVAHSDEMKERHGSLQTLLVCPPVILEEGTFEPEFMGAAAKSAALPALYEALAARWGCAYLDANKHIESDSLDGVHYGEAAHDALGRAVAAAISG